MLTFEFSVVDEQRVVGLSRRVARHLAMTGAAVGALLLEDVVVTVGRVRHYEHRVDTSCNARSVTNIYGCATRATLGPALFALKSSSDSMVSGESCCVTRWLAYMLISDIYLTRDNFTFLVQLFILNSPKNYINSSNLKMISVN